ncbi:MAG TPA: helix-turn-helix domain-containing protein [Candidatus Paceibacterota bacterium]|nr:helix-turn-helix domain-containing protein [Candidatus Paceibacterota bacterium]
MTKHQQQISPSDPVCSSVFKLFGDKWTLRILSSLRNGELRFNEIQHTLSINSATLSARLKRLEEIKAIARIEETIDRLSVTYRLTKFGTELLPVYDDMVRVGAKIARS